MFKKLIAIAKLESSHYESLTTAKKSTKLHLTNLFTFVVILFLFICLFNLFSSSLFIQTFSAFVAVGASAFLFKQIVFYNNISH